MLVPAAGALAAWDTLWAAGLPSGAIAVGSWVGSTTARLEASARSRTMDFVGGYDLVEAGLGRPAKARGFLGKQAYLAQLGREPAARLCTLCIDDHRGPDEEARFMLGGEPVTDRAGAILVDSRGRRSFVTSAGSAPLLGRHLLYAYLPADRARAGEPLAVEYFGGRYPATVLAVGAVPPPGIPAPASLTRG
jgi:glycine cleavage system aminomethyltransferase T